MYIEGSLDRMKQFMSKIKNTACHIMKFAYVVVKEWLSL